jgi:diaminohydroxyphosphoribosylaminopyrimidine deaminase/5-amino-6-(5-phosphoribosylamino)uracil reductase
MQDRLPDNEYFMRLALKQALKAKGNTWPNPLVGAVLVKDRRIMSKGYHKMAGLAHAEIEAFKNANGITKNSTLYITLEPCCTFGRTPPCTEAIINAGIKKVVVGMRDPNPKNNGKGIKILRSAGINVEVGFLNKELREINLPYIKYITKSLPLVTVKVGQSLDGKIATKSGESQWITSKKSRDYAHKLRADFDAIMVGINTIIKDNPKLQAPKQKRRFYKIIIDPNLDIPIDSWVLKHSSQQVFVVCSLNSSSSKAKRLQQLGAKILRIACKNGNLNLKSLLKKLVRIEVTNILVEGGGTLIGSMFDQHLVDKVIFFVAPKIIGGKDSISSIMGDGINRIKDVVQIEDVLVKKIGKDYLFEGKITH